jgi:hypothetical protein
MGASSVLEGAAVSGSLGFWDLTTAIALYRAMEMTLWLPQAEAVLM